MEFDLKDFTYRYFKQDDIHFQRKFSEKREFNELSLPKLPGPLPPIGELYPHQQLGERFLNIWDYVLFDNEPGTGKTGIIYSAAIQFHKNKNLSPEEAYLSGYCNWIEQTIIIVPNETLEKTWIRAYNKYSGTNIMPKDIQILRRDSFYSQNKDTSYTTLIKKYSNTFFAIDEVHELLNRSNATEKAKYDWYRNLFLITSNIKLALATGTTVIMNQSELGLTINLMPKMNMPTIKPGKQSLLPDPWWFKVTENELAKYIGGKISHLKNIQDKAILVYPSQAVNIGKLISVDIPTNIKVIPINMSDIQSKYYYDIFTPENSKIDNRITNPFNVKAITASLSIIPKELKNKDLYLKKIKSSSTYAKDVAIKLYTAVQIAVKSPGIVFIVSKYVETSGNVLEYILSSYGYSEYVLDKGTGRGRKKKLSKDNTQLPNKGKHYIAIRAQNANNAILVDLVGKSENRHGDYIKIILTARVGAIGISIKNAQTYIVLDPDSHMAGELQRENRLFRPGSYDDLYNENISKGLSHEESVIKVYAYRLVAIPVKNSKPDYKNSIDLKTYKYNIENDIYLHKIRIMSNRIAFDAQIQISRNQCIENKKIINMETLDLSECYYGYYDDPVKKIDYSTYDLLYGHRKINKVLRDLIFILTNEGSITVHDFINRNNYNISTLGIYKIIANALFDNIFPMILHNDYGIRVYIGAIKDTLYLQTDLNFTLGLEKNNKKLWPDSYFYSNLIVSSKNNLEYYISYHEHPLNTINDLAIWLDSTDKSNIPISTKIETIESIIINYNSTDDYSAFLENKHNYIMDRFKKRSFFIFNNPTGRILFTSDTPLNDKIRKDLPISSVENSHGPEKDLVLLHILNSQYNDGKGSFNIFNSHTQAKQISIFDKDYNTFIKLEPPMAEYYVYSNMISTKIMKNFEKYISKFSEYTDYKYKIFGIIYDPQADFRIFDLRTPKKKTATGKINKSLEPRGKNCNSYDLEELVDIAISLGLEPNNTILDINDLDYTDKSYKESQKLVSSQEKLKSVINEYSDFYKDKNKYILFVQWSMAYSRFSGKKTNKIPMCTEIYDKLNQLGQIYIF